MVGVPATAAAQAVPAAIETAVLARPVEKGELLSAADFTTTALPPAQARGALAPANAAGMEALRRLAAGAPVRVHDLSRPQLVRRGEPVTILVRSGGLAITAQGRALSSGASGDLVRVVNAATSRTLEGTVEKAGQVRITAP
ncbi:MAG: flagellar basal body P-ring formation chaperone FlgA [Pseudomonadota bacterium]|nr:flagellar basal body P-ring formation chaperone FlgA [Pseudomonadota bacterium]